MSRKLLRSKCFRQHFQYCDDTVYMRLWNLIIGVAPSTQYTHMRNKNSNTQGDSPNVVKVIFHPSGNNFFPFIEVPISKSDVIVENHCLIQ